MKYDAIIFDVSDTLIEYSPNYAKIYGDRVRELGFIKYLMKKQKKKQCLYVGDSPYDVLCSKQIGMDSAWINVDKIDMPIVIPYKEDYRISNLKELLDIFK